MELASHCPKALSTAIHTALYDISIKKLCFIGNGALELHDIRGRSFTIRMHDLPAVPPNKEFAMT